MGPGKSRDYRVLAAARGDDVEFALTRIALLLQEVPAALAPPYFNLQNRSLGFRLLSRAACAMHRLLRMSHSQMPYKLFKVLVGDRDVLHPPDCLLDEFADAFLKHYPPSTCDYQEGSTEMVLLEMLADVLMTDIAQIETRHASLRRLTARMSIQTWVADWEQLVTEWLLRQLEGSRALKQSTTTESTDVAGSEHKEKPSKTVRRPGGAMRAFLHVNYRGAMGSRQRWREAAVAYKALSEEEKQHYRDLGAKATEAGQAGFPAFGARKRSGMIIEMKL